jgi:hypothetical protein
MQGAIDGAKTTLDTRSPSRVFRSIGENTIEGYALGAESRGSTLQSRMGNIFTGVRNSLNNFDSRPNGQMYIDRVAEGATGRQGRFMDGVRSVFNNVRTGLSNFDSRSLGASYINSASDGASNRQGAFSGAINNVLSRARDVASSFNASGIGWNVIGSASTGAENNHGRFRNGLNWTLTRARDAVNVNFSGVGWNAMRGVEQGANDRSGTTSSVFRNIGNALVRTMNSVFGINSPSTVFASIGGYLMDGLENGMEDSGIISAAQRMCDAILNPFERLADDISGLLHDVFDNQIVTTPKLNLYGATMYGQYDPRGNTHGGNYQQNNIGDIHIAISVPDGQSAEMTMQEFRGKFKECITEEIRGLRRLN